MHTTQIARELYRGPEPHWQVSLQLILNEFGSLSQRGPSCRRSLGNCCPAYLASQSELPKPVTSSSLPPSPPSKKEGKEIKKLDVAEVATGADDVDLHV